MGLAYRYIFTGVIATFFFAACSSLPTPPIEVPFSADRKDTVVELDLRVAEAHAYTFGLSFLVDDKTPGDAQRVIALMGDWGDQSGKTRDAGAPLRVKLSVQRMDAQPSLIFNREVSEIYWYSHGAGGYNKRIAQLPLQVKKALQTSCRAKAGPDCGPASLVGS